MHNADLWDVAPFGSYVSEHRIAFIIGVKRISGLGTTLAVIIKTPRGCC
jgi:hypothetical protein